MTEDTSYHHSHHVRFPHIKFPHIHFSHEELHDRPLAGEPHSGVTFHWKLYFCEAIATACLMILGVSAVIILTASDSPVGAFLKHYPALQIALCGLFFGLSGTVAASTRFGKVSGAHLNPSNTLAFMISGKIRFPDACGYFIAQAIGAIFGTFILSAVGHILPFWGVMAHDAHFAATYPAVQILPWQVLLAELGATFGITFLTYWLAAHPRFQLLTPWLGGIYFFCLNPFEAWISGDSTNFTRSLGPALIDGNLHGLWIYLIGPFLGAALAAFLAKSDILGQIHLKEARIINFGHYGRVPRVEMPEAVGPSPERVAQKGDDAAQL